MWASQRCTDTTSQNLGPILLAFFFFIELFDGCLLMRFVCVAARLKHRLDNF